jgi:hypothetical protein
LQVRNPDSAPAGPSLEPEEGEGEEEGPGRPPPARIASKQTATRQGKTKSEMNSKFLP